MIKGPPQISLFMIKQEQMKCNQIERENQMLISNLRHVYNRSDQNRVVYPKQPVEDKQFVVWPKMKRKANYSVV